MAGWRAGAEIAAFEICPDPGWVKGNEATPFTLTRCSKPEQGIISIAKRHLERENRNKLVATITKIYKVFGEIKEVTNQINQTYPSQGIHHQIYTPLSP